MDSGSELGAIPRHSGSKHPAAVNVEIAAAQPEHLPAVHQLARSRRLPDESMGTDTGFLVSDFELGDYIDLLARAEYFYVALNDGRPIGFIVAYSQQQIQPNEWLNLRISEKLPDFIVVKQICVDPTLPSKGVGSLLYRHLLRQISEQPVVAAVVKEPANHPSKALHRKMGFDPWIELTPPDGLPRTVWIRRRIDPQFLREQLALAIDLYKHEDNLNWRKLNNLFYMSVGLLAVVGLAGSRPPAERQLVFVSVSSLGLMLSLAFSVTLWMGVFYLHRRKDAVFRIETDIVGRGGNRVMSPEPGRGAGRLRRSYSSIVLRAIPAVAAAGWTTLLLVALTTA